MDSRWNPLTIGETYEWVRNKFNTGNTYVRIMDAAKHFGVSREVMFTRFWYLSRDGLIEWQLGTGNWKDRRSSK